MTLQTISNQSSELLDRIKSLSEDLDGIERSLIDEITLKSDTFSNSIVFLDGIIKEFLVFEKRMNQVSNLLSSSEERLLAGKKALNKKIFEYESLVRLEDMINFAVDVMKSHKIIQDLLDTHLFSDAINLIQDKKRLFLSRGLDKISVFSNLLSELEELEVALSKLLSQEM